MEHHKSKSMEMDATMWQSVRPPVIAGDELGQSCRVYCLVTGRVPFEWEDEPGKPKGKGSARSPGWTPSNPPLCPSPAMQSARLTDRQGWRRKSKHQIQSAGTAAGLQGSIQLRFHLGRAMKRWM